MSPLPSLDNTVYQVIATDSIHSPALIVFKELVVQNINRMISIAGSPTRLCPHCKTHKTVEVARLMVELGINHQKCATIAEAEMLAQADVKEILLAYQPVGPNVNRICKLANKYPELNFSTIVDHPEIVTRLESVAKEYKVRIKVLVDLDSGMNRTGIHTDVKAMNLVEMICSSDVLLFDGLHWYDGHHRQPDAADRKGIVESTWKNCVKFRDRLELNGIQVNRIVAGGTGSFSFISDSGEPNLQVSPGTTTYFDIDMAERFPELGFVCAIAILTRVISDNRPGHLTLDVGHKSCAADQPAGRRLFFPAIPDAVELMHTEEHLVLKTNDAKNFPIGSELLCFPRHACPTSAVYEEVQVVSRNQICDRWSVIGRNRKLTI